MGTERRSRTHVAGVVQTDLAHICAVAQCLHSIERQGIADAITVLKTGTPNEQLLAAKTLKKAVNSRARVVKKQGFDTRKRTLVGARVTHSFADRCKACAFAEGLSINQWVKQALERAMESCAGRVWDSYGSAGQQVEPSEHEGVFLYSPHRY